MENVELNKIRHSLAHVLAQAVKELYPGALFGMGPAIENGFYYDFDNADIGEDDLKRIEKKMREIVKKGVTFEKEVMSKEKAREIFKEDKYKKELIEDVEGDNVTVYRSGDFVDLCSGPHVDSTKDIKPDAFKLERVAGAYFKGSEERPMLRRVYGLAFMSKDELKTYLKNKEEAEKRDHRKIGRDMDLFHIDEKVGLGLPLWHPKGAMLWRLIEDYWHKRHLESGYQLVRSPHIGNRLLWEDSGHADFYNSSMFPPMEIGQTLEERQKKEKVKVSEEYLIKPMNCPFHIQIYKSLPKSYRDLPLRWAECGTVYRFEKKGELSGLTRVRGFTQDDAHIICRVDQVEEELKKVVDFIISIFKAFGFETNLINVYLSLRDSKENKKYTGDDKGWEFTQDILRKVAIEKKLNFTEEYGEAAFYGPKLDFKLKDALGREWQCSTLQFDFNLPERFDMTFINNKGEKERPYVLHRALFGSFERFIALLLEHYNGNLPFWLAPEQVRVVPVSEKFNDYAEGIYEKLKQEKIRTYLSDESDTLSKKVRKGELQKIPYIIVVGEKEMKEKTVSIRYQGKDEGEMAFSKFLEKAKGDIN